MELKLSVVIVTKDRAQKLLECIESINSQSQKPKEIIIIDSSSANNRRIFSKFSKLKIKYLFENRTMTQGRNRGIETSTGDIVLFLDDDAMIENGYIRNLLDFYEMNWNDDTFAGAEGLIINDKDRRFLQRIAHFPKVPRRHDSYVVRILHGCNMSFRRSVLDAYRFDEDTFGYYADDDDICSRISKKYRLYFVPAAKVVHSHTSTGGARQDPFRNFNTLVYNKFYIFLKSKSIKHFVSLVIAYTTAFIRVFIFYGGRKSAAVKGMGYGFFRIVKSAIKRDFSSEVRKS